MSPLELDCLATAAFEAVIFDNSSPSRGTSPRLLATPKTMVVTEKSRMFSPHTLAMPGHTDSRSVGKMGDHLNHHVAKGWHQLFETDRRTWRRELLYMGDGRQILLVKMERG